VVALFSSLTSREPDGPEDRQGPGGGAAWLAALAGCAVTVAGLLGLFVAVLVVQTLDPDGGLSTGASLAVTGRLWLLAHGGAVELPSGPLVLAPLLLTAGVAGGLAGAGRWAARAGGVGGAAPALRAAGALVAVHAGLVGAVGAVLSATAGEAGGWRALAGAVLLGALAAGWGTASEAGLVGVTLDRLPGGVRPLLRGGLAGALTALGLCTAVVAVAVAADASGYAALSSSLGGAGAGAVGALALGLLLLPNAALAVLGLAAGPGLSVGTGTLVSVHGVTLGAVPALPLLAGLPDTQAVPLLAFASQVVPAVAGLVAGRTVGRLLPEGSGGSVVAGLWGLLTGGLLGLLAVAGTWAAGGALGDGALSVVGAPPLTTGIAVAAQAGIAAALAAAVARWRSVT
jgi:Family of unknown function (DUF6350)